MKLWLHPKQISSAVNIRSPYPHHQLELTRYLITELFLNNVKAEVTVTVRTVLLFIERIVDSDCHLDRSKRNNSNGKKRFGHSTRLCRLNPIIPTNHLRSRRNPLRTTTTVLPSWPTTPSGSEIALKIALPMSTTMTVMAKVKFWRTMRMALRLRLRA